MSIPLSLQAILRGIINTLAAHVPLVQEFTTAGVHAWAPPANAYLVDVFAKGAGGVGYAGNASGWGGGGGGSGYEERRLFLASDLALGVPLCVVVGKSADYSGDDVEQAGGYSGLGVLSTFGVSLADLSGVLLLARKGGDGTNDGGGRGHSGGGSGGSQEVSTGGIGRDGYGGCAGSVYGAGGRGGTSVQRHQHYIPDSSLDRQYLLDSTHGGVAAASSSHEHATGYGTSLGGAAGTPRSSGGTPATGYGAGGPGGGSYRAAGAAGGGGGGGDGLILPGCPSTLAGSDAAGTNGGAGALGCDGYVRIITYRGRVPS